MKKLLWTSLNPTEKLHRFQHSLWLLGLAILVLFLKLEILQACLISGLLLLGAYDEYKRLKRKASLDKNR